MFSYFESPRPLLLFQRPFNSLWMFLSCLCCLNCTPTPEVCLRSAITQTSPGLWLLLTVRRDAEVYCVYQDSGSAEQSLRTFASRDLETPTGEGLALRLMTILQR